MAVEPDATKPCRQRITCSTCSHNWIAEEADDLATGFFVWTVDGWRASCPSCRAHTVVVWETMGPRPSRRPERGSG